MNSPCSPTTGGRRRRRKRTLLTLKERFHRAPLYTLMNSPRTPAKADLSWIMTATMPG